MRSTNREKGSTISNTTLDSALETADHGLRIFPLIEGKKLPDRKGWQDIATTDPMAISMWFREKPRMNYGIRTGLVNNIVVIDLDGPEAKAWWKSTGIGDSTAVVYSPRKDGGEHHYFRIYDVEIKTSSGQIHPNVDVRGEGGLVAGPGSRTPDGVYIGDLSNIPDAPQELLDLLPERQSYQSIKDEEEIAAIEAMEKVSEPSESELSDLRHIETSLLALPRKWSPGDGWHDTVFRSCCWLWRMVRTPSYAIREHQALELMLSSTPVWPEDGWGEDEILKQWDSAREITRGEYADPPFEDLPEPLDFVDTVNQLPQLAPLSQQIFFDALANPNARVKNLIEECIATGLTDHQIVSVIYGSKAGESLRTEYGYRKLWRDVRAAIQKYSKATSISDIGSVPISAEVVRPSKVERGPQFAVLMSDTEREAALNVNWWGEEYLEWTREITPVWNGPYHRMNMWTILSVVFSPYAVIPEAQGDMYLNLFSFILGETTTGKSESLKIMNSVLRTIFSDDDDPDIGGDPSPSALGAALIERDGKSSLLNADEAHGKIARMKMEKGYQTGLMEELTKLYDGEVGKMLRSTNKDISNKRAKAFFNIHYMGTFEGITDVLDPSDWNSGFLHRFIWAIGEKSEVTRESLRPKVRKPGSGRDRDSQHMQKQWAAQFRQIIAKLSVPYGYTELEIDEAFLERFTTLRERMYEIADERPELKERLYPSARRMSNSIWKAAALVAVVQGKKKVEVIDLLVALIYGEEWFGNLLKMVTATDTSKHIRAVAELEKKVLSAGGELRMEDVYRTSGVSKHATDTLVTQLIAEGRAEQVRQKDGKTVVLRTIGEV